VRHKRIIQASRMNSGKVNLSVDTALDVFAACYLSFRAVWRSMDRYKLARDRLADRNVCPTGRFWDRQSIDNFLPWLTPGARLVLPWIKDDTVSRLTNDQSQQHSAPPAQPQPVPLLDVRRQYEPLQAELEAAAIGVLRSGQYVLGPAVTDLERGIAAYCGAKHGIGCASGSDALLLALMAAGIGQGDEVIVPSFTFFATASAPWRLGAKVVMADIDPVTFNLDPEQVVARITPATRAIIPVHLFGQCANMDALRAACQNAPGARGKIWIIEDACQAIGAEWNKVRAGALADMACLSFYPTKNLGGMGDGGMLTTDDDTLAQRLRLLRGHGMEPRYYHHVVGINSRLDSLQAALLSVKLPHLEAWSAARGTNAKRYTELCVRAGLDKHLTLPQAAPQSRHVWNQYVVRVPGGQRDALRAHLAQRKIGTEIYYPLCLHQQVCFASLGYQAGSFPHSEQAAAEVLALPIYPELTAKEQEIVVSAIGEFVSQQPTAETGRQSVAAPKFLGVRTAPGVSSAPSWPAKLGSHHG